MCDTDCNNLIDLSLDDGVPCTSTQDEAEYETQPSNAITSEALPLMPATCIERVSLDNNPFDSVQKLVDRQDDPFDIVEKEVCLKVQHSLSQQSEVKVANLLSLSDDNLLDDKSIPAPIMTMEGLEKVKAHELDLESPPVMINTRLPPTSESDSNPNSSAETTSSAKLKTSVEYRKRLLKYSISNAAFSSPVTRKNSLEFESVLGTPVNTTPEFEEHFLATESPLKLVDDDILAEESTSLVDSEKIFEADLEMMKIPILDDLPSPAVEASNNNSNRSSPELLANSTPSLETTLPNLEAIKAKIKAKKEKVNNNHQQEIVSLINNLKSLITRGDMVDESKKQHASTLLESLSMALNPSSPEDNLMTPQEPQPVKRQGTFNLELEKDEQIQLEKQSLVTDMPASMTSSTATFDGEKVEDRQDLILPEIVSLSPQDDTQQNTDCHNNNNENSQNHLQSDVSDILEQLSKLLMNNNSGDNGQNTNNPTFIVVMNTNPVNQNNNPLQTAIDVKERSAFVNSYLENTLNDGSPDLTKVDSMPRRRSQSLSIHDKLKIVQLSLPLTHTPRTVQKQNCIENDVSPPVTTTSPTGDKETTEFKTPARMVRRNSYSSGTPYTPKVVGGRFTGFGSYDKNSTIQLRKPQTLDSHQEGEQPAVRPITIPSNNLPSFKPDLKKKTKNTESIMKSSGPLRATIPMKKVAPLIKTSPPTPDKSNKKSSSYHGTSLQSQSSKTNRMPTTPLPTKEGVRVGYPNACSTPAFTSPLKRTGGVINKPRYSYMPSTPNSKMASNPNTASTSLRRRTITEFKAKSPLKARASSAGLAVAATASTSLGITSGNSRLSTSAGAKISKTPVKSVYTTASTKATSSRYSIGGSGLAVRNKENKKP